MFLKNRNIISKIKRSKVTDYAALKDGKSGRKVAEFGLYPGLFHSVSEKSIICILPLNT